MAPTSPLANVATIDLSWDEMEARSVKMKRPDEEACKDTETTGTEKMATAFRKTLKTIEEESRKLSEWARERNNKKEIKDIAQSIRSLVSLLTEKNWKLL